MPTWKKDRKEFTVSVNYNKTRGYQSTVPMPIMLLFGEPKKITFVIDGKNVNVIGEKE